MLPLPAGFLPSMSPFWNPLNPKYSPELLQIYLAHTFQFSLRPAALWSVHPSPPNVCPVAPNSRPISWSFHPRTRQQRHKTNWDGVKRSHRIRTRWNQIKPGSDSPGTGLREGSPWQVAMEGATLAHTFPWEQFLHHDQRFSTL